VKKKIGKSNSNNTNGAKGKENSDFKNEIKDKDIIKLITKKNKIIKRYKFNI